MAWREALISRFGPSFLGGVAFGDWLAQLAQNRFRIALPRLPRAAFITCHSCQNSVGRRIERWRFGKQIDAAVATPPLFVIGHWRSGTTHLHYLLALDERFAYPNNYQVFFPHGFLSFERMASPLIDFFLPKTRPMDNVAWTMRSPQEDEFALAILTGMSPYLGWSFPLRREHYERYLTFEGVPATEVARWQQAIRDFIRKLQCKYGRPVVLKSPTHTARIRLLLELFPDARFVHIRRNPYAVFPSTRKMYEVNCRWQGLQRLRLHDIDDYILRQGKSMYDAYFTQRSLVPAGRLHEIAFEELEADPLGQMRVAYEALGLPDFGVVEPALRRYVESISDYKKNRFAELPDDLRRRIAAEWGSWFDEWGYAK